MTGATHILVASALYEGTKSKRLIAFGLAFASHFALDAIPHYEFFSPWNYILAFLAGLYILILSYKVKDYGILIAGFLGALPDLNWILGFSASFQVLHNFLHFKGPINPPAVFLYLEWFVSLVLIGGLYLKLKKKL